MSRIASSTMVVTATTAGNLALGAVNRARVVKIEKQHESIVYDSPALYMSIDNPTVINRQVDINNGGNKFTLGANQTLWIQSNTGSAINVHLIVEDQSDEGIFTDIGTGVTGGKPGRRGDQAQPSAIAPSGTNRTFKS